MKKNIIITLVIFSVLIFSACGKSAKSEIVKKINTSINKVEKSLAKIEEPNESDFLSQELLTFKQAQETFFAMKDEEFVSLRNNDNIINNKNNEQQKIIENENQDEVSNSNINTYYQNNLPRNVNTYFLPPHMPYGYGMGSYPSGYPNQFGMGGFPSGYQNQYGMGMPTNNHNNITNGNGGFNKPIRTPNINTYGLGENNINTYKAQQQMQNQQNNQIKQNMGAENSSQANLNKLSAIYTSASHLVNVNSDVQGIKDRILMVLETLKESLKQFEKSKKELTSQQVRSIEILLENIESHITKLELSKNQLKYEIERIKKIKDNFLSNNSELSARYIMLANFLDTRYSYYSNISNCFQEVLYKIINQVETSLINNTSQDIYEEEQQQESLTITDNDITIENITIENETTLQQQLEQSWSKNYKDKARINREEFLKRRREQKSQESNPYLTSNENSNNNLDNKLNSNLDNKLNTNLNLENNTENKIGISDSPNKALSNSNNNSQNQDLQKNQEQENSKQAEFDISSQKENTSDDYIDGFNEIPTEKKQVATENILPSGLTFNLFENQDDIDELFPSNFPFKKPQKHDFLKFI